MLSLNPNASKTLHIKRNFVLTHAHRIPCPSSDLQWRGGEELPAPGERDSVEGADDKVETLDRMLSAARVSHDGPGTTLQCL